MKKIIQIVCLLLITSVSFGQTEELRKELDELAKTQPGLEEKVQLSVSAVTLSDFISAIALEHNLNVSVDDELSNLVVNNFYDALVKDVFIFIVTKYELDLEIMGSIISFKAKKPIEEPPVVYTPKEIKVEYNPENEFLSLDLKLDSLDKVAEAITKKSDKNVVLSPEIKDKMVSVYIENRPFDQTMDMLAKSNGLVITPDENGFYFVELAEKPVKNGNQNSNGTRPNGNQKIEFLIEQNTTNPEEISISAVDTPIKDIIEQASIKLGEQYFMYDVPTGNTTLKVEDVTFEELMVHIMNGTEFTFKKNEKYFLIGNRGSEGLRSTELIQLENRTVEAVEEIIPTDLTTGLTLKKFVDLNGFIVSGSYLGIEELRDFLTSIDQVVPMVQIDIIIIETRKTRGSSSGVSAGLADAPVTTGGTILPGIDMTFGAESINGLLNALNGFGLINLGFVTPEFYVSLQALESNSKIEIQSTPQIATLNGHEATFSVGKTSYYQEQRVDVSPTISGGNVISNQVWKATDANLDITVTPFVSADEFVTLDIKVDQSDFGSGQVDPSAPPNKTTQSFQSLIRVRNGEMILLGGLERDSKSESSSGTPFLSRIPIIRWFFSSRKKDKEKYKLHVFIKTTVTY